MLVYMRTRTGRYDAVAEFDSSSLVTILKKGSRVSPTIAEQEHFRSANAIKKKRDQYVKDGLVCEDITFKSPSTAACFVGGNSHNGYDDWKDAYSGEIEQ